MIKGQVVRYIGVGYSCFYGEAVKIYKIYPDGYEVLVDWEECYRKPISFWANKKDLVEIE